MQSSFYFVKNQILNLRQVVEVLDVCSMITHIFYLN